MPKVQIPKGQVLEAALQLIIRDGHDQMNIKTVAQELGRSTQTISWTFGNMENFRIALAEFALKYANNKMYSASPNAMEEYGAVGIAYVDMAFDEPNLIRFLRSDEKRLQSGGGLGHSFDERTKVERKKSFAEQYGCSEETAEKFMLNMLVYTQGLVSMIIAGGLDVDRKSAHKMLEDIGADLMKSYTRE